MSTVYAGAVAPEAYALDITPGTSGVDLSDVSDAEFRVRPHGAAEVVWTPVMSNQTATTLTLTYEFEAGAVDVAGPYIVYASLTIPDGTVRTVPRVLTVKGKFET